MNLIDLILTLISLAVLLALPALALRFGKVRKDWNHAYPVRRRNSQD